MAMSSINNWAEKFYRVFYKKKFWPEDHFIFLDHALYEFLSKFSIFVSKANVLHSKISNSGKRKWY